MEQGGTPQERLTYAFRQALQRSPDERETEVLTSLWQKHKEDYTREPGDAEALLNVGEWPLPENADQVELAAWTSVCRAILNLHETITRY
jgi:hypothetical protein